MQKSFNQSKYSAVEFKSNLITNCWQQLPPPPPNNVNCYEEQLAKKTENEKFTKEMGM